KWVLGENAFPGARPEEHLGILVSEEKFKAIWREQRAKAQCRSNLSYIQDLLLASECWRPELEPPPETRLRWVRCGGTGRAKECVNGRIEDVPCGCDKCTAFFASRCILKRPDAKPEFLYRYYWLVDGLGIDVCQPADEYVVRVSSHHMNF